MNDVEKKIEGAAAAIEEKAEADTAVAVTTAAESGVAAAHAGAALAHVNAAETQRLAAERIAENTQSFEEYQAWNATQLESLSGRMTGMEETTQNRIAEATAPLMRKVDELTVTLQTLLTPLKPSGDAALDPAASADAGGPGEAASDGKKPKFRILK